MTIERLLYDISEIALKNNLVNAAYAGPSLYNLNGETVRDYPYIFTSPTDDITVGENTSTYGLTLFFVDRLLEDSSNEVDIFSVGVETLKNLIKQLEGLDEIVSVGDTPIIRLFTETQKMADFCAGAYVRLRVTVLNSVACPVYFDTDGTPLGNYIPSSINDVNVLDNLASKNWVIEYIAASGGTVSGYATEQYVREYVDNAVSGFTTEQYVDNAVSGLASEQYVDNATSGLATEQYVDNATSGLSTEEYVDNAVSGLSTEQYVDGKFNALTAQTQELSASTVAIENRMSAFTTSAETKEIVDDAVSGMATEHYVNSALSAYTPTQNFSTINGSGITEGGNLEIQGGIDSATIKHIWTGTQQEYNALVNYWADTLYFIQQT